MSRGKAGIYDKWGIASVNDDRAGHMDDERLQGGGGDENGAGGCPPSSMGGPHPAQSRQILALAVGTARDE